MQVFRTVMITCILIIWPLVTFENYFCNSGILHKRTYILIKLHIRSYFYKYIQPHTFQHMHYISYLLWYNLTPRVSHDLCCCPKLDCVNCAVVQNLIVLAHEIFSRTESSGAYYPSIANWYSTLRDSHDTRVLEHQFDQTEHLFTSREHDHDILPTPAPCCAQHPCAIILQLSVSSLGSFLQLCF
jgi:hypothetical protein